MFKLNFGVICSSATDNKYGQSWELKPSRDGIIWSCGRGPPGGCGWWWGEPKVRMRYSSCEWRGTSTLNRKSKLQSRCGLQEKRAGGEHLWKFQNKGSFGCSVGNAVTCAFLCSDLCCGPVSLEEGRVGALVSLTVKQGNFSVQPPCQPPVSSLELVFPPPQL